MSNTPAPSAGGIHHPAIEDPVAVDPSFPPALGKVTIVVDGSSLHGSLYVADGPGPHPTVILLHGYPGNERNLDLAQALRRAGMNALYFNYRGTWASGGEFSPDHALEDAARAVALARSRDWATAYRADPARVALVGHSFGGWVGALTAAGDARIAGLAFLAGADFGRLGREAGRTAQTRAGLESFLRPPMDGASPIVRGDARRMVADMIREAEAWSIADRAPALAGRPLLFVAGTRDTIIPKTEHHDRILAALRAAGAARLTEWGFDDDHVFSAHRIELARRLIDWLRAACWPDGSGAR